MNRALSHTDEDSRQNRLSKVFSKAGLVLVIAVIVIFNAVVTPNFVDIGTLTNLILQCFPCVLVGLGMMAVISTGGIDISVGSMMALGACVMAYSTVNLKMSVLAALVFSIIVSAAFGLLNGLMVGMFKIQPTIMTLITMMITRGIAQIITGGLFISLYGSEYTGMVKTRVGGVIPIQMFIIIAATALFAFLFNRLVAGKRILAVGDNLKAARLTGINPVSTLIFVYILSAVLSGFVGTIESARATVADPASLGDLMEMDAIAAVTIGGTPMTGGKARVGGTVMGAIIITLVSMTVNMNNIPYYFAYIFKGIIIVVALIINMRNSDGRRKVK